MHVGPSLRDGYRDYIAVIASLGETRLRDITQCECHWALASDCFVSIVLNPPRNLNAARLRSEAFVKTSADCPADPKLVSDLHGFNIFEDNLYHFLAMYRSIVLVRQLDDNLLGLNIDHLTRGWIGPASV